MSGGSIESADIFFETEILSKIDSFLMMRLTINVYFNGICIDLIINANIIKSM